MNRHTIRYALILVAALAVAALAVARFDGLCSIFSTVWSALEPLAIGAVLAYLLNFIAAALESQLVPPYQQHARDQDPPPHLRHTGHRRRHLGSLAR